MYADGSAKALANALHMVGPVLGDADAYERLLQAFVDTMRRRRKSVRVPTVLRCRMGERRGTHECTEDDVG